MAALKPITAAALVAMLTFPAYADVTGPACVTDGDTLVVYGKRQRTRCVGGTHVRLFGIDAPELKQRCKHASGRDFLCGSAAASFLLEHVGGGTVECRGNSEDRYEDAAKSREIVAERMTPAQIAEAERLAKEWLVEHPEVR